MLLGDLGAEIIKVERPKVGDDTRSWGPPYATNTDGTVGESAYFLSVNRNKKSITVDFKSKQGLEIVHRLAKEADVLVENYVPGTLDKLGLGYEELSKLNPRLIYASITGYGPTGPYAKRPGYDVIIEAEAGLMHITGETDGQPVKVGVAITDLTTGLYAHGAIMASLLNRMRTNRGQKVDLSLLECQVASLANIGSNYLIGGNEATRWGTSHPSIVPYQVFPTLDGYIMIGAGNDGQFRSLCRAIRQEELLADSEYQTNSLRVKNRSKLIETLSDIFRKQPTQTWLTNLEGSGIPFGPINNMKQTFEHPQVVHREMIQEVNHPKAGKIKVAGVPVKYSESKATIRSAPPLLGQHTEEVLEGLGYSKDEIRKLYETNAI
ncbi:CoA-transferase family III [Basidiobolus meristosporus CBS 931.73]|uniref:CoA-transferase family III n=1 Tax=Basidiobolus meristosporus CBS 931.73 TaxID=1314790 RepID=A0A1Y1XXR3_9FUNG|nr:CoA-transferase family III [Basidiobolus meristosporus CBS 931.73]|eukprot:ORX90532.1 CoA-transferase family III [Basidiobolus meristosporus CBS 931.73]